MNTIEINTTGVKHTFELVDHIPYGYMIWNIGDNMIDGYLPLCRLSTCQPLPGGRRIETDNLKAIKVNEARAILNVSIRCGTSTLKDMERYVKRYENSNKRSRLNDVERIKRVLPAMKQIEWK